MSLPFENYFKNQIHHYICVCIKQTKIRAGAPPSSVFTSPERTFWGTHYGPYIVPVTFRRVISLNLTAVLLGEYRYPHFADEETRD